MFGINWEEGEKLGREGNFYLLREYIVDRSFGIFLARFMCFFFFVFFVVVRIKFLVKLERFLGFVNRILGKEVGDLGFVVFSLGYFGYFFFWESYVACVEYFLV